MTDPNLTVMKILASIFVTSFILGLVTISNKTLSKILYISMIASGICLLVAEIWLLFP